ncbi:MAG: NAD-glutamate dehydrogenase, partial [Cohaesibacteraceae bacterium]|nr:NAD-glutamate dehydrogenase [Cohaesibacteraceae bacterium]
YQANFDAAEAVADIAVLEGVNADNPMAVRVCTHKDDEATVLRAKFYSRAQRLELSNVMPIFNNMGLRVAQETGYKITASGSENVWIHDYEMYLDHAPEDRSGLEDIFRSAFLSIWHDQNEDDGFNALILPQAVHWRQVAVLRLLARYRKQSGLDPSEHVQIEALACYPKITGLMLELFTTKFDPFVRISMDTRREKAAAIESKMFAQMDKVTSLDHDRALRRMALVLHAALRTNFYITDEDGKAHPFISLKIDSQAVEDLPAPKPYREIFVWSPRVEGVHIRFGPVARGGLRWSDRRDDFRTEVLGLVKAQQVKNAVIVPVVPT